MFVVLVQWDRSRLFGYIRGIGLQGNPHTGRLVRALDNGLVLLFDIRLGSQVVVLGHDRAGTPVGWFSIRSTAGCAGSGDLPPHAGVAARRRVAGGMAPDTAIG